MFEGFGERGFGGEGEVSGGGRHGGGGGQMDQLWEWLFLLQAMVSYCCCWSGGGKWKYSEASDEVRRREVGNVWLFRTLFLTTHTTY